MKDKIDHKIDVSFAELNFVPGRVIGLENRNLYLGLPFLLLIPEKIVLIHCDGGLKLSYRYDSCGGLCSGYGELTIYPRGDILELWGFGSDNLYKFVKISDSRLFDVERAFSGKEAIIEALNERDNTLKPFARHIESGELITDRSFVGRFLEEQLDLGRYLRSQLRFRTLRP